MHHASAARFGPDILELPTGRARLVPLEASHAPGLFAALRLDPDTWRYMVSAPPRTEEEMLRHVRESLDSRAQGTELPFAVVDRSTGGVVGSTRYMDMQPRNRALEIGMTWYAPACRRTSVNTECKYLLLRHAFESLGCLRVQLKCDVRNERSRKAILRLGAAFEGVLRKHRVQHDGTTRDTAYHSILDDEWPGVKRRLEAMLERGPDPT